MKKSLALLVVVLLHWLGIGLRAETTEAFSSSNMNQVIPDGSAAGLSSIQSVTSSIVNISGLKVNLRIAGEFNGDLYGYLRHVRGGITNFCVLLNRPGRCSTNLAGYADCGLDITFDDTATQGDIHVYRNVLNLGPGVPLTGSWQPDGRRADPDEVLDTSARTTSLSSFKSVDASGEWTLYLADMFAGGTNMLVSWGLVISGPSSPQVNWSVPGDIVYGTALGSSQLNASSTVPGSFTYSPPAGTVLNAGNGQVLSVTFSPTDMTKYNSVTTNVSINVLKKVLTVTATDLSKVYGAPMPSLALDYSGFVDGHNPSHLTAIPAVTTTATAGSPVGIYPISVSGGGSSNYTLVHVSGIFSVTPAVLTITALDQTKAYGAELPTLTASYTGFVNGDNSSSLSSQPVLTTTATASSAAGTYPISVGGSGSPNYTISYSDGTLTVNPVPLTITVANATKTYGAANPALTAAYSGFVNGDTADKLTAQPSISTTATSVSGVGSYVITASGASCPNYTITYAPGTLIVMPAALTISAVNTSKAYGAAMPDLAVSYSGFVNGDTWNSLTTQPTLSTTVTASSPVGTYPIAVSGASAENYTIAYADGTLTVDPAVLTITAVNTNKVFGAPLPGLTAAYSGFVNGDTVSSLTSLATVTTTATDTSPVGTYPVIASGAVGANYSMTYVPGTLTIAQGAIQGALASSANPALPNNPVTFTFGLTAVAPAVGVPTGMVQFRIDGEPAGAPVPLTDGSGSASYSVSTLSHGSHIVVAEYGGEGNFTGTTNQLTSNQIINTPPEVAADIVQQESTNQTKVSITALLSNDTDADNDPVQFVSTSPTSANGGTLSVSNGWVFYTPPTGNTAPDSFTYSISDGYGTLIDGTVTLAGLVVDDLWPSLTIGDLGNGSFEIRGSGMPGRIYRIETAESITNPTWQTVGSATTDEAGAFSYTNTSSASQRFYRTAYP